ncbi:MAG: putative baseplate assembly protein [Cyanobacteria bacterium P01_D01_bin.116]
MTNLNDCGCCEGVSVRTPVEINNRPGKDTIDFRVGTHALFKESMLARLSSVEFLALQALKTREDDDFTIALLDAWATVADVLTFYQELIINEFYLLTAKEKFSILELSRLIGYKLRPGVAASTYLAFTLEDVPTAPERVIINAGAKVQSIPGAGEKPQTFETIEKIEARTVWNNFKPRLTQRHSIKSNTKELLLTGIGTNLRAGDGLIMFPDNKEDVEDAIFCYITQVIPQPEQQRTKIKLQKKSSSPPLNVTNVASSTVELINSSRNAVTQNLLGTTINSADFYASTQINKFSLREVYRNLKATKPSPPKVLALRARASLFGYNAPNWKAMPQEIKLGYTESEPPEDIPDWPYIADSNGQINLDTVYQQIVSDSWIVILQPYEEQKITVAKVKSVQETAQANYTLSSKVTQLQLTQDITQPSTFAQLRQTTIYGQSEELELARLPIETPVAGNQIELEGWIEGLFAGQSLIICGELEQSRGNRSCEQVSIAEVEDFIDVEGFTRIKLTTNLQNTYVRATVTIYGNVALATHGETTTEILGSGDASQSNQQFTLSKPALTYISSSNPSGAESTLQIRVNDILWQEVATLYQQKPDARVYVTRTNDEGKTNVQFGNSETGSRLPTSSGNIQATYRHGIGLEGLVKAEQLSLLMNPPLGVKSVTNPLAPTGAADPETRDTARLNAPLTVRTLERLVSLTDYEYFALSFAGIDKALATWTWNGQIREIFVTVAGSNGEEVKQGSQLYKNLLAAMQKAGVPYVSLRLKSYRQVLFRVAAKIKVDSDYQPEKVLAQVKQSLLNNFSFAARKFGQAVSLSEVMATIQGISGVIAVDVDRLYRYGERAQLRPRLFAAVPQVGDDFQVQAAELLTLDPSSLKNLGVIA